MKKLLALVLCVMMFVSVLSANAFAISWQTTSEAADWYAAIDSIRTALQNAYAKVAADQAMVGTIKAMDGTIKGFVDSILAGWNTKSIEKAQGMTKKQLVALQEDWMRAYMGANINAYLAECDEEAWSDPLVALQDFAGAVQYAFGEFASADNIAELQAVMYYGLYNSALATLSKDAQKFLKSADAKKYLGATTVDKDGNATIVASKIFEAYGLSDGGLFAGMASDAFDDVAPFFSLGSSSVDTTMEVPFVVAPYGS